MLVGSKVRLWGQQKKELDGKGYTSSFRVSEDQAIEERENSWLLDVSLISALFLFIWVMRFLFLIPNAKYNDGMVPGN